MAFTVSQIVNSDFGNKRIQTFRVTPDGATGGFSASAVPIHDAMLHIESIASAPTMTIPTISFNLGVTGTAIVGQVSMTSCVASDIYRVLVISGA